MEIIKQLQAPFSPDEIEWRIGSTTKDKAKGLALAYVTNRAIQNRLDDTVGCFNWKNEYREWKGSQLCGISLWYEERKEWVTKWDGAQDTEFEGVKGGLSDAMKRAAYQWGIGRYLYKLDAVWVTIKPQGGGYVMDGKPPALPKWALPEGATVPKQEPAPQTNTQMILIAKPNTPEEKLISTLRGIAKFKKWKSGALEDGARKHFSKELDKLTLDELNEMKRMVEQ